VGGLGNSSDTLDYHHHSELVLCDPNEFVLEAVSSYALSLCEMTFFTLSRAYSYRVPIFNGVRIVKHITLAPCIDGGVN
jgi:hypothetical protein